MPPKFNFLKGFGISSNVTCLSTAQRLHADKICSLILHKQKDIAKSTDLSRVA